uniref:Uncharacterized protein n=1 Tax=Glossina morsitans morsitans TaxID=37546 RepID=A0A1B0GCB3_GLOMM
MLTFVKIIVHAVNYCCCLPAVAAAAAAAAAIAVLYMDGIQLFFKIAHTLLVNKKALQLLYNTVIEKRRYTLPHGHSTDGYH